MQYVASPSCVFLTVVALETLGTVRFNVTSIVPLPQGELYSQLYIATYRKERQETENVINIGVGACVCRLIAALSCTLPGACSRVRKCTTHGYIHSHRVLPLTCMCVCTCARLHSHALCLLIDTKNIAHRSLMTVSVKNP